MIRVTKRLLSLLGVFVLGACCAVVTPAAPAYLSRTVGESQASSAATLTMSLAIREYQFTGTTSTWTLPARSGNTGVWFVVVNRGSGDLTIQRAASDSIWHAGATASTFVVKAGTAVRIVCDGTYWTITDRTYSALTDAAFNNLTLTVPLPVLYGGTGTSTAAGAATALGLGTADSPTFAGLTVSGGLSAGSVVGNVFVRDASTGPSQNTPADATTYYWGTPVSFAQWGSTAGKRRMIVPTNCTLTKAYVYFFQTAGSAETSTVYVRVNDTTDTAISAAVVNNASETAASNSAMSVTLSAGDFLEVKWVTPTWTTNPTSVAATTVLEFKTR